MFFISSKTSPALYTYYPIMNQEEFNNIIVSPRHQYDVLYGLGQDGNANTSHCKAEDEFSSSFFTANQKNKKHIMITSSNIGTTKSHSSSSRQCVNGEDQDQGYSSSSSSSSSSIVSWFDIGKVTTCENSTSKTRRFITSSTTKKSQTSQKKRSTKGKAFKKTRRNNKKLGNNKHISTTINIVTKKSVSDISTISHHGKQQQQRNISSYSTNSNVSTSKKRTTSNNNDNATTMKYLIKRFKKTVCIHNEELYHSNKSLAENFDQQMTKLNITMETDGNRNYATNNNCPSLQSEKDDHCTTCNSVVLSRRQNVVTPTKSNIVVKPMIAFPSSSVINFIQHNLPLNIQLYIMNKPKNSRKPKVISINNEHNKNKSNHHIVCLKHQQRNWTTATLFIDIRYYINTYIQSLLFDMPTSINSTKHTIAARPSCLFFTRKEMKRMKQYDTNEHHEHEHEHEHVDLVEVRGNISWQRMINTTGSLFIDKSSHGMEYVEMDLVVVVNKNKNNNNNKKLRKEDVEFEEEEDDVQLMVKKRSKNSDDDSSWIPSTSSVESHISIRSKKKVVPTITKSTSKTKKKKKVSTSSVHKAEAITATCSSDESNNRKDENKKEKSIIYHDKNDDDDDDDAAADTMSFVSFSGSTISDLTIDFGTTTTTTTTTTPTEQPKLINHPDDEVSSITPEMVVSFDSGLKQKTQNNAIDTTTEKTTTVEWKNKNINDETEEEEEKKKQSIYNNNNNVMIHIIREDDETIQDCSIVSMDYNLKQMLEHFMDEDPLSTLFINDLEPMALVLILCRGSSSDTTALMEDNDTNQVNEGNINTIYIKKEKFKMFTLKYLIDTVGLSYGRTIYFKLQYYYHNINNSKAKFNKTISSTTANI